MKSRNNRSRRSQDGAHQRRNKDQDASTLPFSPPGVETAGEVRPAPRRQTSERTACYYRSSSAIGKMNSSGA
ncbi:hypothetical protein NHX12_011613 [Muraenolepis orangiensis]|uniref:Uncharacterized protein n=1 Tax=Muraenolepis orangiensis TaxID=630683 RepID=A0A9Q0DFH8_9TELE|nr:hypothetical protein NHX12_011613 [Muraenolepis orangiensis]